MVTCLHDTPIPTTKQDFKKLFHTYQYYRRLLPYSSPWTNEIYHIIRSKNETQIICPAFQQQAANILLKALTNKKISPPSLQCITAISVPQTLIQSCHIPNKIKTIINSHKLVKRLNTAKKKWNH